MDVGGTLGEPVLAVASVEHELVERGLYHRDRRGRIFEIDEPVPLGVSRRRFSMQGLDRARGEWDLVCLALNIKRLQPLLAA